MYSAGGYAGMRLRNVIAAAQFIAGLKNKLFMGPSELEQGVTSLKFTFLLLLINTMNKR